MFLPSKQPAARAAMARLACCGSALLLLGLPLALITAGCGGGGGGSSTPGSLSGNTDVTGMWAGSWASRSTGQGVA